MNSFQDVFISYGRADSKAFALQLYENLTQKGLKVWFDFENIPLGVDFQNQIDDGIQRAHNFLFVIAPHAVNSPYCRKEVELALKRHKRIIPLLHVEQISKDTWQQRHPDGTDADWETYQAKGLHSSFSNMHPAIGKINWVYFRESQDDFEASLSGLLDLIARHKDYIHQHTDFLAKALEWESHQKQPGHLLLGQDRTRAQAWLATRFKDEQPPCTPTDLHCEYITESIKSADNRMTQVFLAYAHEDSAVMEQIRRSLRREGLTVWSNTDDIQTGEAFDQAIKRGIEQASSVLYLISPAALRSDYCQQELNYALQLQKRIIPLLVQETPVQELPEALKTLQYIDLTDNVETADYRLDESQLIKILRTDTAYYADHRNLLVRALRWQRQHQNASSLLRGHQLRHAASWLKTAQQRQQHRPTALHNEYIAESQQQPPASSLDVFISYCEANADLAHRLNDALQTQGKTTWFDRENIPAEVDSQQEIHQGIEASDNVLFLLSQEAIQSPVLTAEVEHAAALNKRMMTVHHQGVDATQLHHELAKVDAIDFSASEAEFSAGFNQLVRTLETDREHVHSHTQWSQRSLEWQQKDHSQDLLLRGNEFAIAKAWLSEAQEFGKQPAPTALQQDYIAKSQAAIEADMRREKRRLLILKSLLGLVSAAFVAAVGAGAFAFNQSAVARKAKLLALSGKSEALFSSGETFNALLEGLVAAGALKQTRWVQGDPQVRSEIATALLNAFYWVKEENRLEGHRDGVRSAAFSTDGRLIATASMDGTLRLWQADGNPLFTLANHSGPVRDVVWWPDNTMLASAGDDGTIKLWRQDGAVLRTIMAHEGTIYALSLSPDGHLLASGGDDGEVKLWRQDGTLVATLTGHEQRVRDVAWSPDGQLVASTSSDRTVRLWTPAGEAVTTFGSHTGDMEGIAWSPDSQRLATASGDRTVKLWTRSGSELQTLRGHTAGVEGVQFSPDGELIASAGDDSMVKLWRADGSLLTTLKGHATTVTAVAFSPDSRHLASTSWDQTIKLWSLDSAKIRTVVRQASLVQDVAFSPDGSVLASGSSDRSVTLWRPRGGMLRRLKDAHGDVVYSVGFHPDGKTLVTASGDRTVKLWDLQTGVRQRTLSGHQGAVYSANVSPDGKTLATASGDRTMKLWSIGSGKLQETFAGHTEAVHHVAWSPNGQLLATASADNTAIIWTLEGIAVPPLRGHTGAVYSVAWEPNGELLATASADNTLKLWNRTGLLLQTFVGHRDKVMDVHFGPDGNTLISASADNTLKVWHLDGTEIMTLRGHRDQVSSLSFQPEGSFMASADFDHQITFWDWTFLQEPLVDNLFSQGCDWIEDYLHSSTSISPDHAQLNDLCQK